MAAPSLLRGTTILFVANEAYFFFSHRIQIARAAIAEGARVHLAAPTDHVWAPASFDIAVLEREGIRFHPLPVSRRGRNPFEELRTLFAMTRLFRAIKPDLLHLLTIKPILYGGVLARLLAVPAVVMAFTGLGHVFAGREPSLALIRPFVLALLRIGLGHPNVRAIFQNRGDFETIVSAAGFPRGMATVIPGAGVELDRFHPRPAAAGVPLALLAARLIWDKGIAEFVEAARIARRRGAEVRFVLVGDTHPSNPRAVPEAQLRARAAEGAVEWWGRRDDMDEVLAAAAVVCLPSTYGEGVPKVLLEALAAGRAVVATDIPGCREVIVDEENGLLVAPGDPEALAAAVIALAGDPARRARLGAAGRRMAEARLGVAAIAQATLTVYRDVLVPCTP